jgi:hypothetical protein
MSILSNLTRKKPRQELENAQTDCPHWELAPRWNSVADMGHMEKVTSYTCTSCAKAFSPEEARAR